MTAFRDFLHRLLASRSHREVRRLMSSVAILDFAVSAISLFEPIYLYTLGFSLAKILGYYFCIYLLYFFLLPLGGHFAKNLGLHHAILFSSPFLIAYYLSLMAMKTHPGFIALAVVVYPLQKILYWPGYHSEISRFGLDAERGRELSNFWTVGSLTAMFGPVFGGMVIAWAGFPTLFGIASAIILLSNIPIASLPEVKSRDGFDYGASFRRLFSPERRKEIIPFLGYGDELLALVIWPVFVYVSLKAFTTAGALFSASLLFSSLVILYIGRLSDLQSRHAVLRSGVVFTAAAWLTRPFILSPFGLLGSDAFYSVSRGMAGISMMSIVYTRARTQSDVVREFIFFEQSLAIGKMLAAAIGIGLLAVFHGSFAALFVLGGLFSLLYARLP